MNDLKDKAGLWYIAFSTMNRVQHTMSVFRRWKITKDIYLTATVCSYCTDSDFIHKTYDQPVKCED